MSLIAYHTVVLLLCAVKRLRAHARGEHAPSTVLCQSGQCTADYNITTTVTHAKKRPPSHSLRRPTLDGNDAGDADEAQVDVPKSGACARALPQPVLACRRPVAGQA